MIKNNILTLTCALALTWGAQAQTETADSTENGLPEIPEMTEDWEEGELDRDTTKLNIGGKGNTVVWIMKNTIDGEGTTEHSFEFDGDNEPKPNRHWAGLEFGVNGYVDANNSLDVPQGYDYLELDYARSLNWSINFFEHDFKLSGEYLKLVTGMGFEWSGYTFDSPHTTINSGQDSLFAVVDSSIKFEKNRLKTTHLNVPLMLAVNTSEVRNKAFHLAAGVVVGYRISSKLKQRYNSEGDTYRPKIKSTYNLNPFRYSATVRVGYGNINLYGSYALNTLFQDGEGPELYPWSVGIRVLTL